jgi:hypothetical protein
MMFSNIVGGPGMSAQEKTPQQDPASGLSNWPRLDLDPPEIMLVRLASSGRGALAMGYLNHADRAVVEQAVQKLRTAQAELFALLFQMSDPTLARKLSKLISSAAGAAYVVGAHAAMTDTAYKFFNDSRATHMRVQRSKSKRHTELGTVIKGVFGDGDSQHPYKHAYSKLNGINRRLSELGQKPTSLSTVYRRLKKITPKE